MHFYDHLNGPWIHVVELDVSTLTDRVLSLATKERDSAVRVVRGRKMSNESRLFDEFAAAHQFPYYFGENWDAFSECINDLSWMPAARYLTVVTDAEQVLAEERERFGTFAGILAGAGREWSELGVSTRPWAPEPRPFHVVLQARRGKSELVKLLAGVEFDVVDWA